LSYGFRVAKSLLLGQIQQTVCSICSQDFPWVKSSRQCAQFAPNTSLGSNPADSVLNLLPSLPLGQIQQTVCSICSQVFPQAKSSRQCAQFAPKSSLRPNPADSVLNLLPSLPLGQILQTALNLFILYFQAQMLTEKEKGWELIRKQNALKRVQVNT
jgi:hypothetical protein